MAVGVVAGGGGEGGEVGEPPGVEAVHEGFAEVFAEHGGGGDGEALGFSLFLEENADGVVVAEEAVFAVAFDFGGDLEGPVVEHEAEEVAVMFAAALAVAEDDEVFLAVGSQEVIQVNGGGGEEDAAFVAGLFELAVEVAFGEDAGGEVHAAGVAAVHVGAKGIGHEADGEGFLGEGEFFVFARGVPAVFAEVFEGVGGGLGEEFGEGLGAVGEGGGEGEDGAFELFEAGGGGVDEFAVVDVEFLAFAVAGLADGLAEEFPEAGQIAGGGIGHVEGAAANDQGAQEGAVAGLINACKDHGGGL